MTDEISVISADPRDPQSRELLNASHALMQSLFPSDSCHYLSIDGLSEPTVHFFVACQSGQPLGCGAWAEKNGYGEVKSMFTTESCRGLGVADRILKHIIAAALVAGYSKLRLETGDSLHAAHRLYQRHGFDFCGPFGDYVEHPNSLFMEKQR